MLYSSKSKPAKDLTKMVILALHVLICLCYSLIPAQAQSRTFKDVEYARAGSKRLLLDIYLPDGAGPFPVIIWIHGGSWLSGDKDGGPAIRQASRGYAVASINYRLSYEAKFPAQLEDCKAAVRWLRANAATYNLDPTRIAAWGSSAGGHLAALLGTTADVADLEGDLGNATFSSRVQTVIDWYGPTDLLKMNQQALPCNVIDHDSVLSPESLLIGCAIQTCKEKTERANPIRYITADDPPFLIMHGTADCLVSPLQSQIFYDALQTIGLDSTLIFLQGAGHGGDAFDKSDTLKIVDDFLDLHLKTAAIEPVINSVQISGKKLLVSGERFDKGAQIYLNNERQKTANDGEAPTTKLIAKKAGKKISSGQTVMVQVRNSDGKASQEFTFTRQ